MIFEKFKQHIIAHAEDVFPEECLGVIVNDKYVRLHNAADEPELRFLMTEADEDKYGFSPGSENPKAQAVVHSHPDGPEWPSEGDMKAQIYGDVPFVIVAHTDITGWDYFEIGRHTLNDELVERPFRHAVHDCYHAIRSWFWQQQGLFLEDCPRRDDWWAPVHADPDDPTTPIVEPAQNLYEDNFKKWGFVQLTSEEAENPQRGDVFLYKLHVGNMSAAPSSIETHGGVYLGDGQIYHHLPGRLSAIEGAEAWGRKASRWIRYEGVTE